MNSKSKLCRIRFLQPRFVCALLLLAMLPFQGCIYLRLLKTKDQLSKFDEYIQVSSDERGLSFILTEPHLTSNDLNRLGIFSVENSIVASATVWKVGFVKVSSDKSDDDNLWLYLTLKDDLLAELTIPQKYVNAFTQPVIVDAARAFGKSNVNGLKKTISIDWDNEKQSVDFITQDVIESVLGSPHQATRVNSDSSYTYRYRKPDILADDEARKEYTLHIKFADGRLAKLESRAIRIDFDK